MVHPRAELANIGEADAEAQERGKFMRLVPARRDADLVQRAPKAIAGMRVVVAQVGRPLSGGGADEDQAKVLLKLVREFFQCVGTVFVKSEDARNKWQARNPEASCDLQQRAVSLCNLKSILSEGKCFNMLKIGTR